jgi:hypothetical protein
VLVISADHACARRDGLMSCSLFVRSVFGRLGLRFRLQRYLVAESIVLDESSGFLRLALLPSGQLL